MCESRVFLVKGGKREKVMDDVVRVDFLSDSVRVIDIMGNERRIKGASINYADLMGHEIVLEVR